MTQANDFVFLHGGAQGSWVWDETIAALKDIGGDRVGTCVALDVPGCGAKRGRDTSMISFGDIVEELLGDIDAATLDRPVLVGHSQAGTLIPRLAEARPGFFRRIMYVSCIAPEPEKTVLAGTIGEDPGQQPADEAGMFAVMKAMFCNDMDEAETAVFAAKLGRDAWPASAYFEQGWRYDHLGDTPATFVKCLRDAALLPDAQDAYAKRLKADRVREIDSGHQVQNTQPRALAEVLLAEAAN